MKKKFGMNRKSKPIQAVFGESVFLRYRIYIVLGVGSVIIIIFLSFADLILYLMNGFMITTHFSESVGLEKVRIVCVIARKEFEFIYRNQITKAEFENYLKRYYFLDTYPDIDLLCKRMDRKTIAAYPIPKI